MLCGHVKPGSVQYLKRLIYQVPCLYLIRCRGDLRIAVKFRDKDGATIRRFTTILEESC